MGRRRLKGVLRTDRSSVGANNVLALKRRVLEGEDLVDDLLRVDEENGKGCNPGRTR